MNAATVNQISQQKRGTGAARSGGISPPHVGAQQTGWAGGGLGGDQMARSSGGEGRRPHRKTALRWNDGARPSGPTPDADRANEQARSAATGREAGTLRKKARGHFGGGRAQWAGTAREQPSGPALEKRRAEISGRGERRIVEIGARRIGNGKR